MDPNAALDEMRRIVARIHNGTADSHDPVRLADLVDFLDEWLSRGGFLPSDWQRS